MLKREKLLLNLALLSLWAFAASAQNRVLELDGNGSHVGLPPNIFNALDEATVEGTNQGRMWNHWSRLFAVALRRGWVYHHAIDITETTKARLT